MAEPVTKSGKPRPWGRVVLVISLGLNLLVAGLVAGAMLNGHRDRDGRPELRDLGFGPFVSALPREARPALAEALRRQEGSLRERRTAMRAGFDALLDALRAEPYDHDAVTAIMLAQQEEIFASQRLGRGLLLDYIEQMTPAARIAFADELRRGLRHWKRSPKPRGD